MMDITEEYVRMSKQAEEIQKLWVPKTGDFYCFNKKFGDTWLPRQDDLQRIYYNIPEEGFPYMGNWFYDVAPNILTKLRKFLVNYKQQLFSMEQLWLAFVMSERYQKIWDGKDWVKI